MLHYFARHELICPLPMCANLGRPIVQNTGPKEKRGILNGNSQNIMIFYCQPGILVIYYRSERSLIKQQQLKLWQKRLPNPKSPRPSLTKAVCPKKPRAKYWNRWFNWHTRMQRTPSPCPDWASWCWSTARRASDVTRPPARASKLRPNGS